MDTFFAFVIVLVSFVGSFGLLGLAAARWGVDSRPSIGDSHAR
jgi:hypothetical protein